MPTEARAVSPAHRLPANEEEALEMAAPSSVTTGPDGTQTPLRVREFDIGYPEHGDRFVSEGYRPDAPGTAL
ncbi:hypothetical protein ACH4SK_34265 [Streptomyces inhibens]|uniref:hypothetical protein n=1 Tax=Streptomyces inhibens TaxID=2293571 RepID=UPI0037B54E3A